MQLSAVRNIFIVKTKHNSIFTNDFKRFFFFRKMFIVTDLVSLRKIEDFTCESMYTVKPVLSSHSKRRQKIGFQDRLSLNAGQKYCRMLQGEHSAILSTFIRLPFVIKIVVSSIFEWPLKTGFTVIEFIKQLRKCDKMRGMQAFYCLLSMSLINSVIQKHEC